MDIKTKLIEDKMTIMQDDLEKICNNLQQRENNLVWRQDHLRQIKNYLAKITYYLDFFENNQITINQETILLQSIIKNIQDGIRRMEDDL